MSSNFKQTDIGLIPDDWEEKVLGDIVKIKHGFAFKGNHISNEPNENILLTPGNFKIGGGFNDSKFRYYVGELPSNYILNEDDIIVTMTDLSKNGDTLGYSAKLPPAIFSISKSLHLLEYFKTREEAINSFSS